jgi:hypothetical protein
MQTVVSSVFGKQFSNMAAKIGSFMRLLMSAMAPSIAGETNFLWEGGGLEQRQNGAKSSKRAAA